MPGTEGFNSLAETTQKLKAKREQWPQKIFQLWKSREVPVFTAELITKINQAFISQLENVNEQRRRVRESLRSDIGRLKKKLDDIGNKRDKSEEVYKSTELTYHSELSLLRPNDRDANDRLHAILTAAYESYVY